MYHYAIFRKSYLHVANLPIVRTYYFQKGTEEQAARRFREAEKTFMKADQVRSATRQTSSLRWQAAYLSQNRYGEARAQLIKADQAVPDNQDSDFPAC